METLSIIFLPSGKGHLDVKSAIGILIALNIIFITVFLINTIRWFIFKDGYHLSPPTFYEYVIKGEWFGGGDYGFSFIRELNTYSFIIVNLIALIVTLGKITKSLI